MSSDGIVISGVGCISPLGNNRKAIIHRLANRLHGFSLRGGVSSPNGRWCAGWLPRPDRRSLPQALQFASHSGVLAYRSSTEALRDGKVRFNRKLRRRCAVIFGTHFGSFDSVAAFDLESTRLGKQHVSPTLFPNTVINAPAGYVGAALELRASNITVATGLSAGLSAVTLGCEMLSVGNADMVLAGGYDGLSSEILKLAFQRGGLRSDVKNRITLPRPIDRERHGLILGEGAAVFVLERMRSAKLRGVKPLGEIVRYATKNCIDDFSDVCRENLRDAIQDVPRSHMAVFVGANGSIMYDQEEIESLDRIFGSNGVDAAAMKSYWGEAAGGNAMSLAAATWCLQGQIIPATLGFESHERTTSIRVLKQPLKKRLETILVNSWDPFGEHVAVVLRRINFK